ncbi:MAG: type IV-A pilus assembly ATPase PilB [Chromatiales bacterium]|jgi:type IV pilus assembly protein PilB|nr:MAG: type IV-A pilus assembly ATPase PilB [Chromatiales bacterium]
MAVSATNSALSGLSRRLVQDALIPEDAVIQALKGAQAQRISLVAYLVGRQMVDARQIAVAAASEFGVPLFDLDAMDLDMEAVKSVDQRLLAKHQVLPLVLRGKRLFLGVADPTDLAAIDEIKFQSGMRVDPIIVEQDKLAAMVNKALEAVDTSMASFSEDDFDLESLEVSGGDDELASDDVARDDIEDAPVVRFVNKIMLDAIKRGASDIHFEPYEKTYRVRTRLDGVLKQVASPPLALSNKVTARLKVMSRLDIAERRVPQDGRIKLRLSKNRAIDFRVNTCPTLFGEKVVLRILDPMAAKLGIEVLGYEDFQRALYLDALSKPYGMILVTGPTGSGKTVSLYTGINILNTEDRNISTCEDPVEINVPGINQVNVNPKVGLHFATALKAFLRQDPDVIMVGEIRDLETAETAIKAAQTGHLVLSTLHTNDAPRTLTRMVDMGVKPYAIATSVHLIIAQRLARRLCQQCKELRDIPEEALVQEGFTKDDVAGLRVFGPVGCKQCNDGYKGRVGIYQVMPVTEAISRLILAGGNAVEIEAQSQKEGVWNLRRSALQKVKDGVTSLEEINRVTIES